MKVIPVLLLSAALLPAAGPAPFGGLVPIGGRKLHLQCSGQGGPVVLFLNGVPRFALHFALVQPEVAKFTRACVYDRAGDAWSEAAPGPPSAAATIEELDAVVRHVSPKDPVVLAYYATHPDRVAGMVLIDSAADAPVVPVGGTKKRMSQLTTDAIKGAGADPAATPRSAARHPDRATV